ncbi:MAG TPA: hypothetical protein VMI94_11885 [Bryobacteraceae bacterium]|nr:hypothetical protein [Bryobacteraceae bacterium]
MPATSPCAAVAVRAATLADHLQIASLESRYGLGTRNYEEWSHLWLANPVFREHPDWTIGWVVADQDRRLVGSLGHIPLAYTFQGRRILACSGRALVAEPPYRSACLMLLDQLINHSQADLYLNNTVGADVAPAFHLFECSRVPSGIWDRAAFWITRYRQTITAFLRPRLGGASHLLSHPLAAAAFLNDRLKAAGLRENDVRVSACTAFDDRFDDFWESLQARLPHVLLAVRTRETLAWHFKYKLAKNQLWIATVSDGPRLVAYAIFERKDPGDPIACLRRMRLVDFQSLDGGTALLAPILLWALRKCGQERIHLLENVGRWLEKGEWVASAAPYRRKLATWTYFYRAAKPGLAHSLMDRGVWAPSLYDGDATL